MMKIRERFIHFETHYFLLKKGKVGKGCKIFFLKFIYYLFVFILFIFLVLNF